MKPKSVFEAKEIVPFVTKERATALLKCLKYLNEDIEDEPSEEEWEHFELFTVSLEHKLNRLEPALVKTT